MNYNIYTFEIIKSLHYHINSGYFGKLILQKVGFWIWVSLAGGIAAELAAKAANVVETLPWDS
jgi:hypothetical protein